MYTAIDPSDVANAFGALGSEPRLDLIHTLVKAGPKGLTVGQLSMRVGIAGSTLTHHLKALVEAGLVEQYKSGRHIHCVVDFDQISALSNYLLRECCKEAADASAHPAHREKML